ncbi:MAG: ABC transporter permease [Lactococcus sp.]|nr:ABC transporter permease [Lactococcus sp.]
MKKRFKIIFLKQDLLSLTTIVLWFLSFLSGFSIIFSRSYLSGGFRVDNVYAMFSMFSNYLLIYMSVQLFGKEFKYSTINSIRICGRSHWEIIVRKLAVMLVLAILTAILSFLVLLFDHLIFNQLEVFGQLLLAYVTYSIFFFALGSLIIFLIKRTLHAFIAIFLTLKIAIALMNVLSSFEFTSYLINYIPLSFLEDAFSFARYTPKQVSLTLIWSAIMLGVLSMLYRKRGFK